MKVLFYSHTAKISGAEKILLLLIKKLNRTRFVPTAICSGDGPLLETISEMNVPCTGIAELNARFTVNPIKLFRYVNSVISTAKSFRTKALEIEPDVIHANSIRAGLVATAATIGTGLPVFCHLQDELGTHPISTLIRIFVLLTKRVRLIAASGQTLDSFRGILLDSKSVGDRGRVVHNVVDASHFRFDEKARETLRDEFEAADDEFLFGVIGQVTPRKGQLELVDAFARCLPEIPKAKLLIIGEPMFNADNEYLNQLVDFVKAKGITDSVRFLGFRDDVSLLLSALDTVVINSKSEAFVVVGIEGLSTGVPVIATDVGGIREMIVHEESGLLVSFGDGTGLESAMKRIAKDHALRKKLIKNGRQIVTDRLNAEVFVTSIEGFFESISDSVRRQTMGPVKDVKINA
jgi:glycosyltransferase involved in cell wall biosynthesis